MAWGRRCELGCQSWPDQPIYSRCPVCGERTTRYSNLRPLDENAAAELAFADYYRRRCEHRGIPVDGPLPDDYELAEPISTDLDVRLAEVGEPSRASGFGTKREQ